jgi:hypothetical protein
MNITPITITAIILSHYKERESNLKRIIDDLLAGTVAPDKIVVFIDNPEINYDDDRVTVIKSTKSFLPHIRFALGLVSDTDYCFFIDDDLTVRNKTLENFAFFAHPQAILGLEGSVLGKTDNPYTDDTPIKRGNEARPVDIIIRTYFVPTKLLLYGFALKLKYPKLPKVSLDDIFLCLGNKYFNKGSNYVIPVTEESDLTELDEAGVGQSHGEDHYRNRNLVCRFLRYHFNYKEPRRE